MPRKPKDTNAKSVQRLTLQVQQLEAENAALKERVRIFTPTEWAAKEYERKLERDRKDAHARNAAVALSWSEDNDYPDLLGSDKQVKWALAIRRELVEMFRRERPNIAVQVEADLREKIQAIWWIARTPRSGRETAGELLGKDAIHNNTWTEKITTLPGVAIPYAAESADDLADDSDPVVNPFPMDLGMFLQALAYLSGAQQMEVRRSGIDISLLEEMLDYQKNVQMNEIIESIFYVDCEARLDLETLVRLLYQFRLEYVKFHASASRLYLLEPEVERLRPDWSLYGDVEIDAAFRMRVKERIRRNIGRVHEVMAHRRQLASSQI
jgi:hypothetical protein